MTISAETSGMSVEMEAMIARLQSAVGVIKAEALAG